MATKEWKSFFGLYRRPRATLAHYDSVMESSRHSVVATFGIRCHIPTSTPTSTLHYPETLPLSDYGSITRRSGVITNEI
jgi:hypothetical protein